MKKLLQLNFLPKSADAGLLILRTVFGLGMLWLHGRGKLMDYASLSEKFPDPLGVGHQTSLILTLLGELVCPALIFVGAFTRLAALVSAITMSVAFFVIHHGRLTGENHGEMAFLFLGAFAALLVAGPGRYSIDAKLGAKV